MGKLQPNFSDIFFERYPSIEGLRSNRSRTSPTKEKMIGVALNQVKHHAAARKELAGPR